jgi:hypothetical protein
MMKATAGQPRNSPSLPGILQIFFHLFIAVLAWSLRQDPSTANRAKIARFVQPIEQSSVEMARPLPAVR